MDQRKEFTMERSEHQKREALRKIVNDARTAYFVTHSHGSPLHGRPMANAQVDESFNSIWFGSQRDSGKIAELKDDEHVLLGYVNVSGSEWASINGTARLVDDRAKAKSLWNVFWKNYFEGPDDPNLVLIEVTPHSAEYWDSGSKAIALAKFAAAAVTGKHIEVGEHAAVKL